MRLEVRGKMSDFLHPTSDFLFIFITAHNEPFNFKGGRIMFNKDTIIGDILEQAPEKSDVLLEVGMHCLSCPAALGETLEEACDVHGIDVNEVLEMLNK